MEQSTGRFSARIEFYQSVGEPDGPRDYVGAVECEDAFAALTVPRVGELVSMVGLIGDTHSGDLLRPWAAGPFLRVVKVEHDPIPIRNNEIPGWWKQGWTNPGVRVVFHTQAPSDIDSAQRLIGHFRQRDWTVHASSGVLEQASH